MAGEHAQHVVHHQHLARALGPGADADGGDRQQARHLAGQRGGNGFHEDHLRAGVLHGQRIGLELRGGLVAPALDLEAAEGMHRLRRQADVRAHRNAAFDQETEGGRQPLAAFELDHLRAGLHHAHGAVEGLLGRAVGAEGQIRHEQRLGRAARHAFGVVDDVVERDGQRGLLALHHVAQRIADQHHVHAAALHQGGEAGIVGRQHGDALARRAHALQRGDGHGLAGGFLEIAAHGLGSG